MHDAADGLRTRDRRGDPAMRIDRGQSPACERCPRPSQNHQGTPFIAVRTAVSAESNGAICPATDSIAGSLDRHDDEILHPEIRRLRAGRDLDRMRRVLLEEPQPLLLLFNTSSVAPRATKLTSQPACASFTPIQPPMAPAP